MDQHLSTRTRAVGGRRWQWIGLGFLAGAIVVGAGPSIWGAGALSSDAGSAARYSASITPTAVTPSSATTYTVTIQNAESSGTKYIDYASVTVNSYFTSASLVATAVSTTSGGTWTAFSSGSTVYLRANGALGSTFGPLTPGSAVSVQVHATAPSGLGAYTWATTASYGVSSPQRIGSDPAVTVATGAATCSNGGACDSTINNGTSQVEVFTTAAPGTTESVGTSYVGTMTCTGHPATDVFSYTPTNGPATITYTLFNTQTVVPICWQSNTGMAFTLPQCSASPPPCIASTTVNYDNQEDAQEALNGKINGTEPGDSPETGSVVYSIHAPAGDPLGGHG